MNWKETRLVIKVAKKNQEIVSSRCGTLLLNDDEGRTIEIKEVYECPELNKEL